ncbi:hypothetical protein MKEN_00637000 [Mycena kentingensis (nom. inval.)]|nr:hypothetical protein MKEN_00637000 [Mycena kentingensis (nom. inval.)]
MPHDAYESESDLVERDIPTPQHFKNDTPVERTIFAHRTRAVNRRGRAICRIMWNSGWDIKDIARIFGVSNVTIDKAVAERKQFYPHDEPENDYTYAGDEWMEHFPPDATDDDEEEEQPARRVVKKPRFDSDDGEDDTSPNFAVRSKPLPRKKSKSRSAKQTASPSPQASTSSIPRLAPPLPSRRALPREPTPDVDLLTFLTQTLSVPAASIGSLTTPARLTYFATLGFTTSTFRAIAQWRDAEKSLALSVLAAPPGAGATPDDAAPGLDGFEVILLDVALRPLRSGTPPPPPLAAHPAIRSAKSLKRFLPSVHGLDLSAHLPLFLAQGFTLERLKALGVMYTPAVGASSSTNGRERKKPFPIHELRRILSHGLQRGSVLVGLVNGAGAGEMGLSPIELLALEFALCGAGDSVGSRAGSASAYVSRAGSIAMGVSS